ncbi:MAG TPA: class I SAM-dependent methyltransferase, partial [Candidatus Nanoarchaeia archaeon]|nr:class I SAM-dependent methyltransferase [Candidatus Nanoarchaeia archaeon]
KDYQKDSAYIKKLISRHKKSEGKELLDVGCGTGKHLQYFEKEFSCTGIDASGKMIAIAKKRCKSARFKTGDMRNFSLKRKFDAITCLFSSIGYLTTYKDLEDALFNFSRHLKKGGVLIIEPWLTKQEYRVGVPRLITRETNDLKIARLNVSEKKRGLCILDFHFLIAEKGKKVRYVRDYQEMGLFGKKKTLHILRKAGLPAIFMKGGLEERRGLFIGVKQ